MQTQVSDKFDESAKEAAYPPVKIPNHMVGLRNTAVPQ